MEKLFLVILMMVSSLTSTMAFAFPTKESESFRHLVLLKFKHTTTNEQMVSTTKAFVNLKNSIDEVSAIEWGSNISTEGLNKDFTHSYLITFKNEKARATYMEHPAHRALEGNIGRYIADVVIFDYWAN